MRHPARVCLSGSRQARYYDAVGPRAHSPGVSDAGAHLPSPWRFRPFPARPLPTGHGVFPHPARDTGLSVEVFPGLGRRTARAPPTPAISAPWLTFHLRPSHSVGAHFGPQWPGSASRPRPGTACIQRPFAPAACCCSAILATTDLSCHSRPTTRLPASRLYGWPRHTGTSWLAPRASPFNALFLSHHAMFLDLEESVSAHTQFFLDGCSLRLATRGSALLRVRHLLPAGLFDEAQSHSLVVTLASWADQTSGFRPGRRDFYFRACAR